MSVLTKKEMSTINHNMLGMGAPVEIDNLGYNQVDFSSMSSLSGKDELSDYDAYKLSNTLLHYVNTQLVSIADDIKETAQYYESMVKCVRVVSQNSIGVGLSWDYNKNVGNYIKYDMDKSHYKWTKPNGNWVLVVYWDYIDEIVNVFKDNGFNVSEVLQSEKPENPDISVVDETCSGISLKVYRPDDSIDTLVIKSEYNPNLVDVYHTVPHMFFNKSDKTWECYIENAAILYDKLKDINGVDASQLEPWSDMVKSWEKSYELVDWSRMPLRFKPYDFQLDDAESLLSHKVMLNANDMGAGKTFEQILVGESIPMKKLVICPPTLRLNWKREIEHVNLEANIHIIYSSDEFKTVDGWNIIGYSSLDKFQTFLEAEKFQVLMIDEAHCIQAVNNNGVPDSKRAYSVLRLAATANYVYPITGTPKTNRNKNLFNILRVIRHPLARGKYAFSNYGQHFCDAKHNGWGWDYEGNSNDDKLNNQLAPFMVRHLKSEVLPDLKKQRIVIPVEVDLREYHCEISEYLNNRTNKNAEDLARLMRARKVLAVQKVGESIDFAKNLVAQNKKVVIVTCFTDVVKAVEKYFKDNCVKLVGGMSDESKDNAINDFQNGKPQVMVMNIIAGGVGVTLTNAHNMIINDFDWTPGNITQAEDRICRSGQTECCNIYYMTADGADMDEVFTETLTNKFSTINNTVDGGIGDEIDFIGLLNKALEKSTGIKKLRKMVKIESDEETSNNSKNTTSNDGKLMSNNNFSSKTLDEIIQMAKEVGVTCRRYNDDRIYRMRLVMAIKKQMV